MSRWLKTEAHRGMILVQFKTMLDFYINCASPVNNLQILGLNNFCGVLGSISVAFKATVL